MATLKKGTNQQANNHFGSNGVFALKTECLFLIRNQTVMKNILAAFAFALLSVGAYAQTATADFTYEITGETTREDLMNMRLELQDKGFDFRYTPAFDQDKKLMTIQLHLVEIGGTNKGSFTSTQLQAGQVVRLVYNTAEDAAVPFCVGICPAAE